MSGGLALRRAGDRGLLVELDDNPTVHALAAAARGAWGSALEEAVPGHTTLLLLWRSPPPADAEAVLRSLLPTGVGSGSEGALVTVPVRYDGPDFESVAAASGIDPGELAAVHGAPTYTAAFIGFAPGFAYLIGGDERLALPRLQRPRVSVEAGSVAIAAGYCAIYPSDGPGGWHLIGHTDLRLFDPDRERPALLAPGTRVRFEAV